LNLTGNVGEDEAEEAAVTRSKEATSPVWTSILERMVIAVTTQIADRRRTNRSLASTSEIMVAASMEIGADGAMIRK